MGSETIAAGALTEYQLRRWYRRIFPDAYVPKGRELTLTDHTVGAWLRSRQRCTERSGLTRMRASR